ncbi:hypothetical protein AeMF1_001263 [Aphanomyces euteiches]|nr:hypothetical protein AeMF1_001263 [Aphanomyces euteiches]KAH9193264.1 hypothetical protein AeNC1_004773 [Aphanomyces euteiches]
MYYDMVADENERLRQELKRCREENRHLIAQVAKMKVAMEREVAYRETLEMEHETLRKFICTAFDLPISTGTTDSGHVRDQAVLPYVQVLTKSRSLPAFTNDEEMKANLANTVLTKSAQAIRNAKTPSLARKGERTVRLQEDWAREDDLPSALNFGLDSVPWQRLLADWAQGDAKKQDYLTQWLTYHLTGKSDAKSPFANPRVELKSMNSNMLSGFLQLVVPTLRAVRPDLNVNVYTKDYVGHSLRIVLEEKTNRSPAIHNTCFRSSRGSCLAPILEHA